MTDPLLQSLPLPSAVLGYLAVSTKLPARIQLIKQDLNGVLGWMALSRHAPRRWVSAQITLSWLSNWLEILFSDAVSKVPQT